MSFPNSFDTPGRPKCARCRHHGIVTPKKGHTKICPFLMCECNKCSLITERTKITALQREMRKAKKEQRSGAGSGGGEAASAPLGPPSGGAPEKAIPADPWRRPVPGGQPVSGPDLRSALPPASGKRPLNAPCFDEGRQMAPLPFIPFPFKMPSYCPRSYPAPPPHLVPNMPWLPPVPVGFGPLMFPQPQQGAVSYPPPGPPPHSRQVFFIHHPPRDSEGSKGQQHPPPPVPRTTEQNAAEQVSGGP